MLGAFGTHGLSTVLSAEQLESFKTGVDYQLYTGLALMVLVLLGDRFELNFKTPMALIFVGLLLFCVSIYLLACQDAIGTNLNFLWPVTPIGGGLQITGWILVFIILFKWKEE